MSLSLILRSARSGWGRLMQSSTAPLTRAGEKWRESQGMGRSGNEDGPLHDLSDFHFADGTPAPETRKQQIWKKKRLTVVDRLEQLEEEMQQLHEEWAEFDKNREEIELARAAEQAKVAKPVTIIKPAKKRSVNAIYTLAQMESRDINERITYWRSMCETWSKNESKPEHYINNIQEFLMSLVSEFAKVKIEEIPKRFPQAGPLLNKLFHLNAVRSNVVTSSLLLRCIYYFTKKSAPNMEERGLNWAAQRLKSVHNATKLTNLDKMLNFLGFSNNTIVQTSVSHQARDLIVKLDLFESKLLGMSSFTARKVLRELSESMIPLLDDETYWPIAERIISCQGTLMTTSTASHDEGLSGESMDIIEDEHDTRQEEDRMVLENLGLKRPQQPKDVNSLDLPIGSIDSQKIHGPSQEESYNDLHPRFLERILAADLYQKLSNETKAVLWTKYPSTFYDEVYNIIEDAMKGADVSTRIESMTEVFCYRPALFQYVISVLRALFKDTQHKVVVKVCRIFVAALVAWLSRSNSKTRSASLDLFFDADQASLAQQIGFGSAASDRQVIAILANYK